MAQFPLREFLAGDVIFKEDAKGEYAYLLKEGDVEISTEHDGEKVVLAKLSPITVFGEMALLLDNHRRTASATALSDAKIVEMNREIFEQYLKDSPLFISALLDLLVERLRQTTQKALTVPDPVQAVSGLLEMFDVIGNVDFPLDRIVTYGVDFLRMEGDAVYEAVNALEEADLVVIGTGPNREKTIRVKDRFNFLAKAKKVRRKIKPIT